MKPAPPVTRYVATGDVCPPTLRSTVRCRLRSTVQRFRKVPPQRAVSRILFPSTRLARACGARCGSLRVTIIPLGPALLAGSSDLPGGFGRAVLSETPPYLVLLRAGFCLPSALRPTRCALTAPFHPYLAFALAALRARSSTGRAVYFLCHCPSGCPDRALPGALPSEFGLSSPPPLRALATRLRRRGGSSGPLRRNRPRHFRFGRCTRDRLYPSVSCLMLYCSSFL